jgi:rare lipoprotein A
MRSFFAQLGPSRFASAAAAVCLVFSLAACGSTDPRPDLGQRPASESNVPSRGYYKVGRAYQVNGAWYTPAIDYGYDQTGIASWYGPGFDGRKTANGEVYDQYDLTAAHPTLPMPSLVRVTNLDNGRQVELRVNDRGPFHNGRILDVSRRGAELLGFLQKGTAKVRVQVLERESRQLAALAQNGEIASSDLIAKGPGAQEPRVIPRGEVSQVEPVPVSSVSAQRLPAPQAAAAQQGRASRALAAPRPDPTVTQVAVGPTSLFIQAGAFSDQDNALRLAQRLGAYGQPQVSEAQVGGQRFWRVRLGPISDVGEADTVLAALIDGGFPQSRVVVD